MKNLKAITVVGGGPIGLKLATRMQSEGWETTVIEDNKEIGVPENCSGLLSIKGWKENNLEYYNVVRNKVKGARLYSPNNTMLEVEKDDFVAYVIDRAKFDKLFYDDAKKAGVDVRLNTKAIDVHNNTVFVQKEGRGELLKSKIVVGCDGANSKIREIMGIDKKNDLMLSYQVKAGGVFDKDFVELYFGSFAPDFFGWIIPESKYVAKVGIGTFKMNVKEAFEKFVREKDLQIEIRGEPQAGLIPIGEPIKELVKDNMLLAGDAAFQTKATTGGGIILGLQAADYCAKAINGHFKYKEPLENYNKYVEPINKELNLHLKIRKYLNGLDNKRIDKLFTRAKKYGVEDFLSKEGDMDKPSVFVKKVLKTPSLWRFAPEAIKVLQK